MHFQKSSVFLATVEICTMLDLSCIPAFLYKLLNYYLKITDFFRLEGNPLCSNDTLVQFCGSESATDTNNLSPPNSNVSCPSQACPPPYEYSKTSAVECFCAAPLLIGYRLKSPGFSDFHPYLNTFENDLASDLNLFIYQLEIDTYIWQEGPRLIMYLKLFPVNAYTFNRSEVLRIYSMFTTWAISNDDIFGPYELLNFTLLDPYKDGKYQKLLMIYQSI